MMSIAAVLTACGENNVGSGVKFGQGSSGQAALGSDPTPSPTKAPTAPPTAQQAAAPPTHAPAPPPTAKPQVSHFAIAINSDSPQFNPPAARVYSGTIIDFTNHDTVARSVVEDDQDNPNLHFSSGPIAPGQTWSFTAGTAGTFHYRDGTRPYVIGYFEVVAHP